MSRCKGRNTIPPATRPIQIRSFMMVFFAFDRHVAGQKTILISQSPSPSHTSMDFSGDRAHISSAPARRQLYTFTSSRGNRGWLSRGPPTP